MPASLTLKSILDVKTPQDARPDADQVADRLADYHRREMQEGAS